MRLFRRSLLCLAIHLGAQDTFAITDEPPKNEPTPTPEALRAAKALREEIAKTPFLQDLPSISRWNEPWTRDLHRLWLSAAEGEDVVILRRVTDQFLDNRTYVGDLEVRRKGVVISAQRGLTVCYAPFHFVEPPCGRFIVLMRPAQTKDGERVGAYIYELPSLREVASIVPEKADQKTSQWASHDYAAVSHDGRALAIAMGFVDLGVGAYGEGSIEIHTGVPLQRVRTVPSLSKYARATRMRFSRDGRRLAVVYRNLVIERDHDRRHYLRVFEAPTWEGSNVIAVGDDFYYSAPVWSNDGEVLFYLSGRSVLKNGKLEAPKELPELAAVGMSVCLADATPSKLLTVGMFDLRIADGARVVARFRPNRESKIIALTDDGRRIAAWTNEDGLGLWDTETILKPR